MQEAARRAVRQPQRTPRPSRSGCQSDYRDSQRRLASARRVSGPVEFLDLDDVVGLAVAILGDPAPIREIGLLGAAVARPQTTAFGEDAYPDIRAKAAALLHSIAKNHALVDGNKRLGWLATAVFLEINGIEISKASNDDVYDLVIEVAAGQPTIEAIAERLRQLAP
jgi:death-on-curing protein